MGCDIHCYIEYSHASKSSEKENTKERWASFGGRVNPGRNYYLFNLLAGVRGDPENAIFAPRGYPDNLGWYSSSDLWLYVTETGGDGCISRENAGRYRDSYKCEVKLNSDGSICHVRNPDTHTHSYLNVEEYAQVLAAYSSSEKAHQIPEYNAVLAAMRSLETEGYETRLIFWFDN